MLRTLGPGNAPSPGRVSSTRFQSYCCYHLLMMILSIASQSQLPKASFDPDCRRVLIVLPPGFESTYRTAAPDRRTLDHTEWLMCSQEVGQHKTSTVLTIRVRSSLLWERPVTHRQYERPSHSTDGDFFAVGIGHSGTSTEGIEGVLGTVRYFISTN